MPLCLIYGRVAESSITDALFSLAGPGYFTALPGKDSVFGVFEKKSLAQAS